MRRSNFLIHTTGCEANYKFVILAMDNSIRNLISLSVEIRPSLCVDGTI